MAHASLLNDNLAHKIVLALLQDGALPSARYTDMLARVVAVLTDVRASHSELTASDSGAESLTATDALAITSGCLDNSGGYRDDPVAAAAFKQGAEKVYNAIELQARDGFTSFDHAVLAAETVLTELYAQLDSNVAGASERYDGAKTAHLLLEAATHYGLSDGQVFAAHQIGTRRPIGAAPQAAAVSAERGEQLIADLEEGIASPAAEHLHSRILAGDKNAALKALAQERMTGPDAEDLYAYCRQKWLGKRLTLVEVPREQAEEIVRKNLPSEEVFDGFGPEYIVRRGESVVTGYAMEQRGRLWLSIARDRIEVKDVSQLWMVVELPATGKTKESA